MKKRTMYAGDVTAANVNQTVTLMGWVKKRRSLGNLIFVDLRDRAGIVQLVFSADFDQAALDQANSLRSEYVIEATGVVKARKPEAINKNMKTGEIEVEVTELNVLNKAKTPVFDIDDNITASEDTKLKYRFLDLRRPEMQKALMLRSKITMAANRYFDEQGFIYIETPDLTKSTPEGARDYLVPSVFTPAHFTHCLSPHSCSSSC